MEIEAWIVDSSTTTRYVALNPISLTSYCECDGIARVANGVALSIEGLGDILVTFQSYFGEIECSFLTS